MKTFLKNENSSKVWQFYLYAVCAEFVWESKRQEMNEGWAGWGKMNMWTWISFVHRLFHSHLLEGTWCDSVYCAYSLLCVPKCSLLNNPTWRLTCWRVAPGWHWPCWSAPPGWTPARERARLEALKSLTPTAHGTGSSSWQMANGALSYWLRSTIVLWTFINLEAMPWILSCSSLYGSEGQRVSSGKATCN